MSDFPPELVAERVGLGLTARDMAARLGCHKSTIYKIEANVKYMNHGQPHQTQASEEFVERYKAVLKRQRSAGPVDSRSKE